MKIICTLLLLPGICLPLAAQVTISTFGNAATVDFSGFTGIGFSSAPVTGQLSSNDYSINGLSDGNLPFGGNKTTGDFARGTTAGGVITGGIYAYQYATGNTALWIQPSNVDFNPGNITLRAINSTGGVISSFQLDYTAFVLNDQARGSTWNFSYSLDDVTYTAITALDITSDSTGDNSLSTFLQTTTLSDLSISDGAFIYLRWNSNDTTGIGSRDEFGLDDISITATQQTACDKPTNVNITNITSSKATINWDAVATATKYKVWYRMSGTLDWTKKSSTPNSKNISGLLPATEYECKVKAVCGEAKGKFSSLKTFTTLPLKIQSALLEESAAIFPNPGNGLFSISLPESDQIISITIFDQLGRKVMQILNSQGEKSIEADLQNKADGIYLVRIDYGNRFEVLKLVKE